MILIPSDFTGKHKVAQDCYSQLQAYINKYEPIYLINLLGSDLYKALKEDYNEDERKCTEERLQFILDSNYTGPVYEGLIETLKGFIFFEYVRENRFKITETGIHVNTSDSSRQVAFSEFPLFRFYNDAIHNYKAIQYYLKAQKDIYPDFSGVSKSIMLPF
jgi:hypothetical protein